MTRPVPADFRLSLDPSVRVIDDGRALVGGSPMRVVRLTDAGGHLVERLGAGEPVGKRPSAQRLARRLLDSGMAHPVPPKSAFGPADVTVVIPTFGNPAGLTDTLQAISNQGLAKIVVVDDATPAPEGAEIETTARLFGARYLRLETNRGPAAARNLGLTAVGTPLVAFIDRDVVPEPGWLRCLLDHFADPAVVAVAPRIRPETGSDRPRGEVSKRNLRSEARRLLRRYESSRSPLDLGPLAARVQPRTRVSYVPSTLLVARTESVAGDAAFDVDLRFGEDVDLVWRLTARGSTVRYEPMSHAHHPVRPTLAGMLRQRFDYGTAAGSLARRHPGAVPPVAVSGWSTATWLLVAAGQPVSGLAVAAIATAQLPAKLGNLQRPWAEAIRLAGMGTWHAWRPLANATMRTWWPLSASLAVVSPRARRAVITAALATSLADWIEAGRPLDPVTYTALHVLDDLAYGAGVWAGCVQHGTIEPLLPDFGSWPPRSGRTRSKPVPLGDAATSPEGVEAPEPPPDRI